MNATRFPIRTFLLFALLSAADFAFTWHLLARAGSHYEANPVANWWLGKFGWLGLAMFKALTVLTVASLVALVGSRKPAAARNLLRFGCAAVGVVVAYSAFLAHPKRAEARGSEQSEVARVTAENARMDGRLRENAEYRAMLNRLAEEVVAGRMSLVEAVDLLAAMRTAQDPLWHDGLKRAYPQLHARGRIAATIVQHSLRLPDRFPNAVREIPRLRAELKAMCGVDVPLDLEHFLSVA